MLVTFSEIFSFLSIFKLLLFLKQLRNSSILLPSWAFSLSSAGHKTNHKCAWYHAHLINQYTYTQLIISLRSNQGRLQCIDRYVSSVTLHVLDTKVISHTGILQSQGTCLLCSAESGKFWKFKMCLLHLALKLPRTCYTVMQWRYSLISL